MFVSRTLRDAIVAGLLATVTVLAVGGCATPRQRDWREAVKAGDYAAAYSDLFETWRVGTPDVKAEALRYAWRDPGIVAVARKDLAERIQPVALAHAGDLASLTKAVKDGPLEDRVEFAKLVDRRIDVDGEIAAAFANRGPGPAAPLARPAAVPAPDPALAPAPAPARVAPAAKAPVAEKREATPAPPPAPKAPPAVVTPPPVAAAPPGMATPPSAPVEKAPAKDAAPSPLAAQVAEARKRAVWRCQGAPACARAWTAAENFVAANSDMRIRTASATTIDTYPPIVIGEIGMKVEKRPAGGDESELQLTVSCRAGRLSQACPTAELRLYAAFPAYLRSSVAP